MPRTRANPSQLELFGAPPPARGSPETITPVAASRQSLAQRFDRLSVLARQLPPNIRFGTSSWSFPGWAGIVFEDGCTESFLAREGLPHYVRHPLLRTVGIDRSYYAPMRASDFERYAAQLPPGFPCCAKVPSLYTSPVNLGRARGERGAANPDFLLASRFLEEVAGPMLSVFRDHVGPVVLEFPPLPRQHRLLPGPFVERLERFLEDLPAELPVAVELRDPSLLTPAYAQMLTRRSAAHVYNYWSDMPMPAEQLEVVPIDAAPFVVVRLLLRPGTRYDDRKKSFTPFDRIVDADPAMREQVIALLRLVMAADRSAFVLVNNKAEGSAPLTVEALAQALVAA